MRAPRYGRRERDLVEGLLQHHRFIKRQEDVLELIEAGWPGRIQTVNLDHLVLACRRPNFAKALESADYITADGWPIVLLARCLVRPVERTTGSQALVDIVSSRSMAGRRWALYGGTKEVGTELAAKLSEVGQRVAIHEYGKKETWDPTVEARRCEAADVDSVLIAVSQPFAEEFSSQLSCRLPATSIISVGAGVEMLVNLQARAPRVIAMLGLEWLYRLANDPRRLCRRYLLDDLPFFIQVVIPVVMRRRGRC